MKAQIIPLHGQHALIPSMPAGRPACSFCHLPKSKKTLIQHPEKKHLCICFDCVKKATKLLKGAPVLHSGL
jgi:hypothetical protein